MNNMNNMPICMTEEYWANSQFSVVRYYGRIKVGGHEYVIVNKDGMDVFALSAKAEKQGKELQKQLNEDAKKIVRLETELKDK